MVNKVAELSMLGDVAIRKYVKALRVQDCPCLKSRISVVVSGCHLRGKKRITDIKMS